MTPVFIIRMLALIAMALPAVAFAQDGRSVGLLMLQDRLDRPQDGYCLDVIGFGQNARLDLPLIAHNCKQAGFADQAVQLEKDTIVFPAYKGCVTVIAPFVRPLPDAALMVRQCGEHSPFLETPALQKIAFNTQGQLQVKGSDQCLAVGGQSDQTSADTHRWRGLSLKNCAAVPLRLSQWVFKPYAEM